MRVVSVTEATRCSMSRVAAEPEAEITPWLTTSILILMTALSTWLRCKREKGRACTLTKYEKGRACTLTKYEKAWKRLAVSAVALDRVKSYWSELGRYLNHVKGRLRGFTP